MSIAEKLLELRKSVPYLQKNKKGYQYSYVSGADTLGAFKAKMDELCLLLVPSVTNCSTSKELVKTKKDEIDQFVVTADMTYTWIDCESGERLEVAWYCTGMQDDPSKALGSGLTYSERYFILKFFNIATDNDDPDAFQKKHEVKEQTVSDKQIDSLVSFAKEAMIAPKRCKELLLSAGYKSSGEILASDYDRVLRLFKDEAENNKTEEPGQSAGGENGPL